jgi:regulation of enolase protein 1 (concanavalin A-like superfamily)
MKSEWKDMWKKSFYGNILQKSKQIKETNETGTIYKISMKQCYGKVYECK